MLETLLVTNKAIISFLNQTMSSRILGPNFLPGSGPSILRYPDHRLLLLHRLLLHRLLHRPTDLAMRTAFVTSVESMAVALPTLSQSIFAAHPTGSDTRLAAKNLESTKDNSANRSRGKNSLVSHHKSNDNILMAKSDTLSGHVDVTMTPRRTRRSIVTAVADNIAAETHCSRMKASKLGSSRLQLRCHDQSTALTRYPIHHSSISFCTPTRHHSTLASISTQALAMADTLLFTRQQLR